MKCEEKKEKCGIDKLTLPDKICQASCSICKSDYLKEIHLLRKDGAEFSKIVEIIDTKYKKKISRSALCRHFKNYNEINATVTAEIINKGLVDDAMKRAVHSSAVIDLIDQYLILLKNRLENGLIANVADFEKLMNIRYKLLSGDDSDEKNLTVVFENAINRYKVEVAQPSLNLFPDEPLNAENSQERKEED